MKWAGTRRNDGKPRAAKRRCTLQHGAGSGDVMHEAQATARLSGAAGTAAASDKGLRQDGNPLPRRGRAETAQLALCEA